jgi:cell division protein FtsB
VNPRRIILVVYAVVLVAISLGAGAVLLDARAQYKQMKQTEATNRLRLAQAEARLHEQELVLQRLKTDPEFVERAIRERLKYAKPGEVIFRFPSD